MTSGESPVFEAITRFLREHDADRIPHPGGTLLEHLVRVAANLAVWGADRDLQRAGLCHAVYGTDGFERSLVAVSDRATVRALIGDRAEALVYLYASCDRAVVYLRIDTTPVLFRDRFTGCDHEIADADLRAFLELTAANELDVMANNAELAALHGQALYDLFDRCRRHLSPRAWAACGILV
ncbi:DUF6817 domain-containing protein [Nocardia crassostreae]|uniref:DUF6817 domain-containing protein n=1 Tax=Nocardia crassostreae TaxID=53428 RepID=UPI000833903D|nr:hypothetical protein [Nocardia crassostreae]